VTLFVFVVATTKQLTQLLQHVLWLPHNTLQKILSVEVVQNKKIKGFSKMDFPFFSSPLIKPCLCLNIFAMGI